MQINFSTVAAAATNGYHDYKWMCLHCSGNFNN